MIKQDSKFIEDIDRAIAELREAIRIQKILEDKFLKAVKSLGECNA